MLKLTRRCGESVVIDERIVVHVIGIDGNYVRLGFEDIDGFAFIRRSEVPYDRKLAEQKKEQA